MRFRCISGRGVGFLTVEAVALRESPGVCYSVTALWCAVPRPHPSTATPGAGIRRVAQGGSYLMCRYALSIVYGRAIIAHKISPRLREPRESSYSRTSALA